MSGVAARDYLLVSGGNVAGEVYQEYLKNKTPPAPDDDLHVVW